MYPFVSVELHRNLSCIAALDTNAPLPRQGQALLKAKCGNPDNLCHSLNLGDSYDHKVLFLQSPYCGDSTKFLRGVVLDLRPQNCNFFPLLLQPTTFFFRFCTLPNIKKTSCTLHFFFSSRRPGPTGTLGRGGQSLRVQLHPGGNITWIQVGGFNITWILASGHLVKWSPGQ